MQILAMFHAHVIGIHDFVQAPKLLEQPWGSDQLILSEDEHDWGVPNTSRNERYLGSIKPITIISFSEPGSLGQR